MSYSVHLSPEAREDLAKLRRSEHKAFEKARVLLHELIEHPRSGTGKPKPLIGDKNGLWSRRITQKHRMVYSIEDDIVEVFVLSSYGHYDDK